MYLYLYRGRVPVSGARYLNRGRATCIGSTLPGRLAGEGLRYTLDAPRCRRVPTNGALDERGGELGAEVTTRGWPSAHASAQVSRGAGAVGRRESWRWGWQLGTGPGPGWAPRSRRET